MKKINGKIIDFILYVFSLYCREKTIVVCDGEFVGYAYGEYPIRRYVWTLIFIGMVDIGLMEG